MWYFYAGKNLLHQTLGIGKLPQVQLWAAKMRLQAASVLYLGDLVLIRRKANRIQREGRRLVLNFQRILIPCLSLKRRSLQAYYHCIIDRGCHSSRLQRVAQLWEQPQSERPGMDADRQLHCLWAAHARLRHRAPAGLSNG